MLSVIYSHIPDYLHGSGFYQALDSNDPDDVIQIPADFYKADDSVASIEDFAQLLRVMSYWVITEIPVPILHYCNGNDFYDWENVLESNVPNGDPTKRNLGYVFDNSDPDAPYPIIRAAQLGENEIQDY